MKMEHIKIAKWIFLILLVSMIVFSQELNFNLEKKSYKAGENITINFNISNPTSEEKKIACVVSFDPPINREGCPVKSITLNPGETFSGSLSQIAEFSGKTNLIFSLMDSEGNIIKEERSEVKIFSEEEKFCGDEICSEDENFLKCKEDCPSGSKDGYCDGLNDNKCDPDCKSNEDEDCKSETKDDMTMLFTFIALAFLLVVFLIYFIKKKRKKVVPDERVKIFVREKLAQGESPEILKKGLEAEGYSSEIVEKILSEEFLNKK